MEGYFKDFTLENCTKILKKRLNTIDFTVKSFKFCALDGKAGYLGEHCYLKIYYEENGQNNFRRFFAKSMPYEAESAKLFLEQNGGFTKECIFYKSLVADFLDNGVDVINDCTPICYLIADMKFLIFEDLSTENYQVLPSRYSMNLECVKKALDSLAKLHCSGFIYEEKVKERNGEFFSLGEKYPALLRESFFTYSEYSSKLINGAKTAAKTVIDLLGKESPLNVDSFKRLTEDFFDNFPEFVKPSKRFRNTICHGDLWSENFMFKFEDNKPVHSYIVDFQMVRYSPPAQDVMSFVYLVTDQKFRREHMEYLLNYYYENCAGILKDYDLSIENILPSEEYIESCDYYKIFANCIAINHHSLITLPEHAKDYLFANGSRLMFGDRMQHMLKFCGEDEVFRKRSFENINDLKQILIDQGKL